MLRLVDMDNVSSTQRHATAMRQIEKIAYMCLVPDEYPTIKRVADKIAAMSEHSMDLHPDES